MKIQMIRTVTLFWAFDDEQLPLDQQRAEPAQSSMVLMKRLRAGKEAEEVAEATQMQDDSVSAAARVETDPTSSKDQT